MARRRTQMVGDVLDMSYHRNGVSGRGFWTVIFTGHPSADPLVAGHTFVANFFPEEEMDEGVENVEACISVLRVSDLNENNADQAWRGDTFHGEIEKIVEGYVWPFDRKEGVMYDGAGREINNRARAIREQKLKSEAS